MGHISTIHEADTGEFTVRSVLIQGQRFSLIWDSLTHPRDMENFARACSGQTCFVVYSHADWDHIQGTAALDNRLVIGHRECALRMEAEAMQNLAALRAREPGRWDGVRIVPPDITFDRHLDLNIGDLCVSLHHLPGHTPDAIVGFIPAMKLLLAGDAVELPCPSVPPGCNLGAWIRSLESWRNHAGVRTVLPAHGPSGHRNILDANISYLRSLSRGEPPVMTEELSAFYAKVHRDNLRNFGLRAP